MSIVYPNPKGTASERARISEQTSRTVSQDISKSPTLEVLTRVVKVPDPWVTPTMTNSWVAYGGAYESPAYMKHPNGVVEVRGTIKNGTLNTAAFTLPEGYRPAYTAVFQSTDGRIEVSAAGVVTQQGGAGTALVSVRCAFLAKDSQPQVLGCWPIQLATQFMSAPQGLTVISVKDISSSDGKVPGRINVNPYPEWEYVLNYGTPKINIRNLTGLPYSRQYELKFLVIGPK